MQVEPYDNQYFDPYLQRGRLSGRHRGDRGGSYRYWMSFLKRRGMHVETVIEVGCGLGFLGARISDRCSYIGIDISFDALTRARDLHGLDTLIRGSADVLPFRAESCDVIFAFDVIEHLASPSLFLEEARRVLRKGGLMVLTTPNIRSFGVRMKSSSNELVPAMYRDKTHVSLLPRAQWFSMLKEARFLIDRAGTDFLWDLPYWKGIPLFLQKGMLLPINMVLTRLFGFARWGLGENLVIVVRK